MIDLTEKEPVIQTIFDDHDNSMHFVIGLTEAGFEYYLESGLTHHFDFTEQGVPIKITLFGNKTRAGAMAQLAPFVEQAKDMVKKKGN